MVCPRILISLLTLILLNSSPVAAQSGGRIELGQSLSATSKGSSWLSTSRDFAFGFHQVPNNSNLFLLAIWYAKIPDTIVWYANDGNLIPHGSSLKITATDGLLLNDPQGAQLWSTANELSGGAVVSYAFMNDTGNFVLKSSNSDAVWQSFDHPTNTLLPTQILEVGSKVQSQKSDSNFTKWRFQLLLQADGNLVLSNTDLATGFAYAPYYASGTYDTTNPENRGNKVIYDKLGNWYIQRKNGSIVDVKSVNDVVSSTEVYQRITLEFYGLLAWYSHPRTFQDNNSSGWSRTQSLPNGNICVLAGREGGGSGACGYNSICSIDENQKPTCQCPPRYSLQDSDDTYGSCIPDFTQDVCEKQGQDTVKDQYELIQLQNTDWPYDEYAQLDCNQEECKNSCLNDCFCAAATFNEQSCVKKKFPLSNGQQGSGVNQIAWVKVGNDKYSNNSSKKIKYKRNTIVVALLGGSIGVIFLLISAIVFGIFFKYSRKGSPLIDEQQSFPRGESLREYSSVHCFSYKELEEATDGFEQEIGQGAFGTVYKGKIIAGGSQILVAVKKLHRLFKDTDKEFKTEVNVIGQTHHKNLVRFIGFCKEQDQRLLVYEYMRNGTVADYLFGDMWPRPSWTARIQIVKGIANGLVYLHEECITQIIHCDIKPQNILIDDLYNARISDFGLAKLLDLNQTQTNTGIRGTKGYLAPEWFRNRPITVKVDVYSFGVLLLEIICLRKNVSMNLGDQEGILTDWAFDCYEAKSLEPLVNDDIEALNDRLRFERLVMVALWCIQEDPNVRPTMKEVTRMLEGGGEIDCPPCPASFSVNIPS